MSSTRLLILGAVRSLQPAHGYLVRRELMSWRVDRWAHLNPGSVYNALRSLERDGFLVQVAEAAGPQGRTTYRLTPNGETEFLTLLREALWTVEVFAPDRFTAGLCFMGFLSRDEVVAALQSRLGQIEEGEAALEGAVADMLVAPTTPDHVTEVLRLAESHVRGEADWISKLLPRLRNGEYRFAGE